MITIPYLEIVNSRNGSTDLKASYDASTGAYNTYSKLVMWVMDKWNATAKDSNGQEYKLALQFAKDGSGRVQFPNLYNRGIRYAYDGLNYSFHYIDGTLNRDDNTITIEANYSGGMYVPVYYGWATGIRSGQFSRVAGTLGRGYYYSYDANGNIGRYYNSSQREFYQLSDMILWDGYRYKKADGVLNTQVLSSNCTFDGEYSNFDDITGTFTVNNVYHETPHHQWAHTAGGELHTYEDLSLHIGKSVFYNEAAPTSYGYFGVEENIDWTDIDATKVDVTHHCDIDESTLEFGYGTIAANNSDKYLYIGGEVTQLMHNHHLGDVDCYEYFVVPGSYSEPKGEAFNDEKGHINGLNVTSYVTDFVPGQGKNTRRKVSGLNEGNSFNLLIPEKAFTQNDITPSSNGEYTLYVKANYKTEGLEPTFHALTPLTRRTTGVNDLVLDLEPASIEVVNGNIVIEGSNGTAMVSTLSGVVIYQGDDATVAVAPGTYIVRAGGTVKKLLVK